MSDLNLTVQEGDDVYLSITETPAVVTLSQPVVASVMVNTVTVANVVSVNVVTMPALSVSSVSVSNFPATQVVTGTVALDASSLAALESITVTVGNVTIGSSISVSNFPVSQVVSVSNLPGTQSVSGTVTANVGNIPYVKITDDLSNLAAIDESNSGLYVSVAGSVTLPISGTVTANVLARSANDASDPQFRPLPVIGFDEEIEDANRGAVVPVQISTDLGSIKSTNPFPISGTVTVGNSVTIGSCVTHGVTIANSSVTVNGTFWQATQPVSLTSLPSTTVTVAAMPNGTLTTRFGTPTTASTAFLTTAVTNTSRKYLLIQNVTTASNVITVGIGFTPTTTQGIQLAAGAGITFESSYIPTGAVWVLSSVTASNYTILEA